MTLLLILAAVLDVAVVSFTVHRALRSKRRGRSLRLRIFLAMTAATLTGAFATGLYATALDAATLGFAARFMRVLPKGFLLASGMLPVLALLAAWVGARLARPVEDLSDAAARIAEGDASAAGATLRSGRGAEAQKLARALTSMRREIADKPYAAAFLRDAWHDLKTPVAAIVATLEVLEDGAVDDPEAARRFLGNLRRSTDQLDRRLQDLVTLARFETAALREAERADVAALVERAVDALKPLADARGARLTVATPSKPRGDARIPMDDAALGRAIGNLLDNAIRASPGGAVVVAVDASTERRSVTVDVSNEPACIPEGQRPRLFERGAFASRPDDAAGSGLGLAIARAAVEAHGGTIRFVEMGPPRVVVRMELPR